ncbi:zinc finger A20 and AN1 domain-containing stress-associated protein 12-like [Miscanthus floridulus]|uniref:zinc finger A20 and AN1 domain-containing stress-associated protein 12-like n=1 Tax=Miscanthus floridulus TaxID=154761 RepID=UPI00345A31FF
MYPSSATTAPAGGGGEAAAAAQCGGCSAPLPRAALGRGWILMFGTAETRDLCARCTLEYYYRTGGLGAGRSSTGRHATCPFAFAAAATGTPPAENQNAVPRPKANRCAACPKKVGLLGFACRCGGTFCSAHRHADSHGCSFDCRGFAREAGANR